MQSLTNVCSLPAQASNVTSSAAAGSKMQGTVVIDSAVILLEGKTLPATISDISMIQRLT
jgi:hypothetical protein